MKLDVFATEQWMTDHEQNAAYNLTDTCLSPLTLQALTAMDDKGRLKDIKLDYGEITGNSELKKEILSLYKTGTLENLTLTNGCNEANKLVMETLLKEGDEVLTWTPGYQSYVSYPESLGCHVTELKLYEEDGWQGKKEELLRAFDHKIRLVIINRPHNPTGSVFNEAYISLLIELAKKAGAWILSDEVYRPASLSSLSDLYEKGISTSSLSKLYSLAGLRMGWIKGREDLIQKINERRDYSLISTGPLIDTLSLVALEHKDLIYKRNEAILEGNKAAVRKWLEHETRCSLVMPAYGTVSFLKYRIPMKSAELSRDLQKKTGVFFVPGSCFHEEYHLRLGLTPEAGIMEKGLSLFSDYLDSLELSQ